MLLAYTDDHGKIWPADKAAVRLLFRERYAWKLGTHFRSVWCAITVLQVGQKLKDGWTCGQIDQQNQNSHTADINLFALLFQVCAVLIAFVLLSCDTPCCVLLMNMLLLQGAPDAPTDQVAADRCLAQMYRRKDIDREIFKVRQTVEFQAMQATLTAAKLAEYGMIPARVNADLDFEKWIGLGICLCAAARVYRHGLSPADALHAVVMSRGLKAAYFGVP